MKAAIRAPSALTTDDINAVAQSVAKFNGTLCTVHDEGKVFPQTGEEEELFEIDIALQDSTRDGEVLEQLERLFGSVKLIKPSPKPRRIPADEQAFRRPALV